ncbi:protein L-Myc-1b-like [Lampris incognitus]|uniref:protein L-Myc-1b-like n=1 Tax=Lampris incognitus TaxID=2546036 RepID=UPI0024B4DE32|nr:protein L-Myc-1b-like [Lampris incognitus]
MEFDCYQHYFLDDFDTEEDFYKSTAPSEEIWKKFELLPSPPMSPAWTPSGATMHLSSGDKLSWLSKILGQDEELEGQFIPKTDELLGNRSSIVIQDCMWSCFPVSSHMEKVNERLSTAQTHLPLTPHISVKTSKTQCTSPDVSLAGTLATDLVDPTAVLTFPANSCRKQVSSGSESRSDSSDDEEEIDVVTVESKQSRARLAGGRKPVTITVRADSCPKRFHVSIHRQQHNYAARSPDCDPEDEEESEDEPQSKRTCLESSHHLGSQSPSSSDSPQSSDTEHTDRRQNHNFQERKRRRALRSRFMALRDQIPGLVESTKTPKVTILDQAIKYLLKLHTREKQQIQEKKHLKARQQQLVRRLTNLKRS